MRREFVFLLAKSQTLNANEMERFCHRNSLYFDEIISFSAVGSNLELPFKSSTGLESFSQSKSSIFSNISLAWISSWGRYLTWLRVHNSTRSHGVCTFFDGPVSSQNGKRWHFGQGSRGFTSVKTEKEGCCGLVKSTDQRVCASFSACQHIECKREADKKARARFDIWSKS